MYSAQTVVILAAKNDTVTRAPVLPKAGVCVAAVSQAQQQSFWSTKRYPRSVHYTPVPWLFDMAYAALKKQISDKSYVFAPSGFGWHIDHQFAAYLPTQGYGFWVR